MKPSSASQVIHPPRRSGAAPDFFRVKKPTHACWRRFIMPWRSGRRSGGRSSTIGRMAPSIGWTLTSFRFLTRRANARTLSPSNATPRRRKKARSNCSGKPRCWKPNWTPRLTAYWWWTVRAGNCSRIGGCLSCGKPPAPSSRRKMKSCRFYSPRRRPKTPKSSLKKWPIFTTTRTRSVMTRLS